MNGVLPQDLIRFGYNKAHNRSKYTKLKNKSDFVSSESSDDIKDYAETTMNELLGWYGYEKLDTRDTQALNLKHFGSNESKLSVNTSLSPSEPIIAHPSRASSTSSKSKEIIVNTDESRLSTTSGSDADGVSGDGNCRFSTPLSTETNSENKNENKDSAEDNPDIPPGCIICAWCAKVGIKLFTLRTANGCKAFCSELCFTQCRRASFKKNKICDWCKHVRHTVNYVDFQDGEQQLQFCSNKCLNQYKMNIFCNETKAHLHLSPNHKESNKVIPNKSSNLITPDLWLKEFKNRENSSIINMRDSSETDSDVEFDDIDIVVPHLVKRKFNDISKDQNDSNNNNSLNNNNRESICRESSRDKTNRESKRQKQYHNKTPHSSRHSSAKHINQSNSGQNEWSSRESRDKTSNLGSPPFRPHPRHSPQPSAVPGIRAPIVGPNNNIPNMNGLRSMPPINGSPSGQLFPRLPDHHIRPQLLPSNPYPRAPPIPGLLGPAHMEMLMRMQSGLSGLRPPLPYPPLPHNGHPFNGLNNNLRMNASHQTNGPQIMHPSLQAGSIPSQLLSNSSLLPPMTLMVPFPVPIPVPIPIPIPILIPVKEKSESINKIESESNNRNKTFITNNNEVTNNGTKVMSGVMNCTSTGNSSKVESVITKLVERKTKAANNRVNKVVINNDNEVNSSLDLRLNNSNNQNDDSINHNDMNSDNSRENIPQNLVVSRNKRCNGLSISPSVNNGYRVQ